MAATRGHAYALYFDDAADYARHAADIFSFADRLRRYAM